MSLRFQISIRILLISLCILSVGGALTIWQARNAVSKEVDSSISLALQLIKLGISSTPVHSSDLIYRLSKMEQTRHLTIHIRKPSGEIINITKTEALTTPEDIPPTWFINLVVSEYPSAEFKIESYDKSLLTIIIQANPLDEITEVWHESIAFFCSISLIVLLTFIAVQLVFNKTIRTIKTIVDHLKHIESGLYKNKLPVFAIQEYDDIARAINHMTEILDATQEQNRALTQHSLHIQEKERQHLSQELHDEFGQSLTAIKVMAVTAAHEKSDTQQITTSIVEICDSLMSVVRTMMKQLHPLILSELGLKATLVDLISHWDNLAPKIKFNLQVDAAVDNIDKVAIIQVYRVIQEGLTNIIRHSQANQVTISLKINAKPDTLKLLIKDNGIGCDLHKTPPGFGLQGMEERIKLLNGHFELHSDYNQGMTISVRIPLQPPIN